MKYHTLFFSKLRKISQNLSSAAVVIGVLRVNPYKPNVHLLCMLFCCLVIIHKINFLYQFFLGYEYPMNKTSGLIWFQTVCKGYQQTMLVGKYLRPWESFISPLLLFTPKGSIDLPSICLPVCPSVCPLKSNSKTIQASLMKLGM